MVRYQDVLKVSEELFSLRDELLMKQLKKFYKIVGFSDEAIEKHINKGVPKQIIVSVDLYNHIPFSDSVLYRLFVPSKIFQNMRILPVYPFPEWDFKLVSA